MRIFIPALALLAAQLAFAAQVDPPNNAELEQIKVEDQDDRKLGPNKIDWSLVNQRDERRRDRVLQIIKEGSLKTDADYFNAALVFQHAATADDIRLAHALAQVSSRMNPDNKSAAWLVAASWDRLMMRLAQPQWYATQFVKRDGRWVLYQVNEAAVSDEERIRVGARTLSDALKHAEALNLR